MCLTAAVSEARKKNEGAVKDYAPQKAVRYQECSLDYAGEMHSKRPNCPSKRKPKNVDSGVADSVKHTRHLTAVKTAYGADERILERAEADKKVKHRKTDNDAQWFHRAPVRRT
jgi:hypothetical protein